MRIVRAFRQEDAEIARFAALNEGYLEKNMRARAALRHDAARLLDFRRTRAWSRVIGFGGALVVARHDHRRQLRRVRHVPRHADLAADRARLGDQPVSARRGVDDATARHSRRALRAREPAQPRALPPRRRGRSDRVSECRLSLSRRAGAASRAGYFATSASPRPAGATIGVVGATASGKSALMDLVPRFFDPQEGEILNRRRADS